jgi:hypothetical protein
MNSLTRLIGYSLLLLLVFLGATLGAQSWLRQQTQLTGYAFSSHSES